MAPFTLFLMGSLTIALDFIILGMLICSLKFISYFFRKPTIWGRNGFDGDKEALVAYRVLIGS